MPCLWQPGSPPRFHARLPTTSPFLMVSTERERMSCAGWMPASLLDFSMGPHLGPHSCGVEGLAEHGGTIPACASHQSVTVVIETRAFLIEHSLPRYSFQRTSQLRHCPAPSFAFVSFFDHLSLSRLFFRLILAANVVGARFSLTRDSSFSSCNC